MARTARAPALRHGVLALGTPLVESVAMKEQGDDAMDLLQAARDVRENAYAPYSNFKVGAAVRAASGASYAGCNVENVAYPEGTCAEAGAIAAMVAAGETGGVLDTILNRLADFLEKSQRLKRKVIGAMIYPAVVIMGIGALVYVPTLLTLPI